MIERYLPKKMKTLFSDEERFQAYLDVEIAVDEAWCELGIIPQEDIDKIKANAKVDVNRINELELITKHDVVAFTRQISETLGEEKRWTEECQKLLKQISIPILKFFINICIIVNII